MTNPSKAKGDRAERAVAALLTDLLGRDVVRKLGAGRREDTGDLYGIPDTVIQVADWARTMQAINTKVPACVTQQQVAGATFGATAIKCRGLGWMFVLTPEQYATYVRESL